MFVVDEEFLHICNHRISYPLRRTELWPESRRTRRTAARNRDKPDDLSGDASPNPRGSSSRLLSRVGTMQGSSLKQSEF